MYRVFGALSIGLARLLSVRSAVDITALLPAYALPGKLRHAGLPVPRPYLTRR